MTPTSPPPAISEEHVRELRSSFEDELENAMHQAPQWQKHPREMIAVCDLALERLRQSSAPKEVEGGVTRVENVLVRKLISEATQPPAEHGRVVDKFIDEHADDFRESLLKGEIEDDGRIVLWGVYIAGTNTPICHTGNGPTSEQNARFIEFAFNNMGKLLDAAAPSPPQGALTEGEREALWAGAEAIDAEIAHNTWYKKPQIDDLVNCAAALRSMASRLTPAKAEAGWQPIETAPRDDGFRRMLFVVIQKNILGRDMLPEVVPGYISDGKIFDAESRHISATHWQPLPSPPALTARTARETQT